MTQAFFQAKHSVTKGQRGLGDSCNYTPCGVNHPLEKHRAVAERLQSGHTRTALQRQDVCLHILLLFIFVFQTNCIMCQALACLTLLWLLYLHVRCRHNNQKQSEVGCC